MTQPIKNNVLVRMFEGDGMSEGGIIVADSFRTESNKGEVVAVGRGTKDRPMQFKKGDIVYRVQKHGIPVGEDGNRLYMMDQSTILATE